MLVHEDYNLETGNTRTVMIRWQRCTDTGNGVREVGTVSLQIAAF